MRQIPIELEPPEHTDFRTLVEPFFKRPDVPASIADMESLICSMVTEALIADQVDAVHDFALPLQCRVLTRLLNVPESEADIWKEWGVHALTEGVEEYTAEQFSRRRRIRAKTFSVYSTRWNFVSVNSHWRRRSRESPL